MNRWLPHLTIAPWALTDRVGDAEGYCLVFEWLGLIVEFAVACRPLPPREEETLDAWDARQW